jgi:hypothetical protein
LGKKREKGDIVLLRLKKLHYIKGLKIFNPKEGAFLGQWKTISVYPNFSVAPNA